MFKMTFLASFLPENIPMEKFIRMSANCLLAFWSVREGGSCG